MHSASLRAFYKRFLEHIRSVMAFQALLLHLLELLSQLTLPCRLSSLLHCNSHNKGGPHLPRTWISVDTARKACRQLKNRNFRDTVDNRVSTKTLLLISFLAGKWRVCDKREKGHWAGMLEVHQCSGKFYKFPRNFSYNVFEHTCTIILQQILSPASLRPP